MKLKNFCKAKDTVDRVAAHRFFTSFTSDRGMIFKTNKELKKPDISKLNDPIKKSGVSI